MPDDFVGHRDAPALSEEYVGRGWYSIDPKIRPLISARSNHEDPSIRVLQRKFALLTSAEQHAVTFLIDTYLGLRGHPRPTLQLVQARSEHEPDAA